MIAIANAVFPTKAETQIEFRAQAAIISIEGSVGARIVYGGNRVLTMFYARISRIEQAEGKSTVETEP